MPTIEQVLDILNRLGLKKVVSVGFGILALVLLNCFHSTPAVDLIGNVVIGGLTLAAIAIPTKNREE
jgi:hypothetical protein